MQKNCSSAEGPGTEGWGVALAPGVAAEAELLLPGADPKQPPNPNPSLRRIAILMKRAGTQPLPPPIADWCFGSGNRGP